MGECDVRLDPIDNEVILRHDSFFNTPLDLDEEPLGFDRLLERLCNTDKSIKIDLKLNGFLADRVLEFIDTAGFDDSRLWFNGSVETLLEQGFRKLASAHPDGILQCPIDFLAPLICGATDKAKEILEMFTSWGINRFSIDWQNENLHPFFDQMAEWEFDVNIYKRFRFRVIFAGYDSYAAFDYLRFQFSQMALLRQRVGKRGGSFRISRKEDMRKHIGG